MTLESQVQTYFAKLEANPNDLSAVARLERLYGAQGQWGELVTLLHGRASEASNPTLGARLLFESGRVAALHLEDADLAAQLLNLAYETGAETQVAYEVQLYALALRQQWDELQGFFAEAVGQLSEPADQSRLYSQLGVVLDELIGDPEQADQMYSYALQLDANNLAAMWCRQQLAAKTSAWERVAELLYAELQATENVERQLELMLDLGDVYREQLGQDEAALQCYQNVYEYDNASPRALAGLAALGVAVEAPASEPAPVAQEEEADLAEIAPEPEPAPEVDYNAAAEGEDGPTQAFDAEALAAGAEDLVQAQQEEAAPENAFAEEEPTRVGTSDEVAGAEEEIVLGEGLEVNTAGDEGLIATAEMQQVEREQLQAATGDPQDAPGTVELDEALIDEVTAAATPPAAPEPPAAPVDNIVDAEDDEELLLEEGPSTLMFDDGETRITTRAAVSEAPAEDGEDDAQEDGEPEAEDELLAAAQEFEEPPVADDDFADDVEEPPAASSEPGEQVAELLAAIDEAEELDAKRESIYSAALIEWLSRDGEPSGLAGAIWGKAFEQGLDSYLYENFSFRYSGESFWRALLESEGAQMAMPSLRTQILLFNVRDYDAARALAEENGLDEYVQLLDDMASAQENWRKYQRDVEQRYPDMDRDERNEVVYAQLAQMAEALDDSEKLFDALRRLDRISELPSIKGRLQLIYRDTEKWPAYVDLIKQEADSLTAGALPGKLALWREAIWVYTEHMRNDMQAVSVYKQILEEDPENLQAIDELEALYEKNNRTSDQIAMLELKVELAKSKRRKVDILAGIALLYLEKFRNQGEAIKYYERVLEIAPHHTESIEFLKESYEKRREWEKLIELKEREIETMADPAMRLEAYKQVAEMAASNVRDLQVGIDLWHKALIRAPHDQDVLFALEELYDRKRDYEPLADIMEKRAEFIEDADERLKHYQKLGSLLTDRIDQPERALDAWESAYKLDDSNLKARKTLERLYVDGAHWARLEALFADKDEWNELARMLEQQVGGNIEDDQKIELLLRAARVWRENADDVARAERALDRIHQQFDPQNEDAALQLMDIYRDAENWEGLDGALQIVLGHRESPEHRRPIQRQLAALHANQLEDYEVAFAWMGQIVTEDPVQFKDADKLEWLAAKIDGWFSVVDLYREGVDVEGISEEDKVTIRMRMARVLSDELQSFEEALEQYNQILADHPEHTRAMGAMASIYERQERWDELMEIYKRRLALVDNDEERVQTLHGIARIAEFQAEDRDRALSTYLEAYELLPTDEETLAQLHRLYATGSQWPELTDIIDQEIAIIDARALARADDAPNTGVVALAGLLPQEDGAYGEGGVEAPDADEELGEETPEIEAAEKRSRFTEAELERLVDLNHELGIVHKEHRDNTREALLALGRVLVIRPSHREALLAIEDYLRHDDAEVRRVASELAEPVYEVHGRWTDLISSLEIQISTMSEPEAHAVRHEEIARIYLEELGMPEESFRHYGEVLKIRPADENARQKLDTLADALGAWAKLIDLYDGILPSTGEGAAPLRIDYLFTMAKVYADHVAEPYKARECYYKILDAQPDSTRALDELEALYERAELWRDMLDVYERRLSLAEGDDTRVRELRFALAALWNDRLGEAQEAIDVLKQDLADHPEDIAAMQELDFLYAEEQMWEELEGNLRRQLELASDSEQSALKIRLGEVHEQHLGHVEVAVDLYEEVLGDEPESEPAVAALERVMQNDAFGAQSERASHILEPWYTERMKWSELVVALEVQVDHTPEVEPEKKIALLHRVAALWEENLAEPVEAMSVYARALTHDIENEHTSSNLYRIAEGIMEWEKLVHVLEETAADQGEFAVKRDLLRQAASIYVDHIGDVESTAARLHEVIEFMPDDLESIEDLEGIYSHLQEWDKLVEVLKLKADVVEDEQTKKDLLHKAGMIYEEVTEDTFQDAIDVYNIALGIDPTDMHSIDRLEVLYTQLERWVDLLENYNRKLDLTDDIEAKKDLLYVIGGIHQGQLEEPMEAIDVYRRIVSFDPMELGALEKLDELYERTEQWPELLETLEREIELSHLPEDKRNLQYRVGRLHEQHLGDGLRAVDVYRDVLNEDPAHEATTQALAGMVERGEFEVEAAQVLQPIYENVEAWDELVYVMRLLLGSTQDEERQIEILREIASIHEGCRDDKGSAFQTLGEALAVDPSREDIIAQLWRLSDELLAWDPFIDLLDMLIESVSDFVVVSMLQTQIARVYKEKVPDPGAAIDRYVRVLESDPVDEEALSSLHQLYQQEGRWEELTEILRSRVEHSTDPDQRLELRLQLGVLLRDALDDPISALDAYQDILLDEPGNESTIQALEEMFMSGQLPEQIMEILEPHYLSLGEHSKLVELYSQRLGQLEDSEARHALYMQIARIYIEEIGQPVDALQPLSAALYEIPSDVDVCEELERIAVEHEQWPTVAQTYMTVLEEAQPEEADALRLWLRLADAIENKLQSPNDAEGPYLQVLALDPGQPQALAALDRIYTGQNSWEELAEILKRRIVEVYDEVELIELNLRMGRLCRDQLAEPENAIEYFRSVLDLDDMHQEALESLEQLYLVTQQWEDLYRNLASQVRGTTDPDRQADLLAQQAQIAEDMLEKQDEAVELLDRVILLQPDNRDALGRLRRLYVQQERWEQLVDVIEREINLTDDMEERLALYENLGVIWGERLEDDVRSLEAWQAALSIDEYYLPALEAMRDLHTRRSDYFELSSTLAKMLDHEELSQERRLELWIEQADIQSDMLMQPQEAIEAWNQVMLLDPGNNLALEALERLYLQEGHWDEAVNVLDIKINNIPEEERLPVGKQIAELLTDKIMDYGRAAQFHEYVLQLDPHDEDSYRSLEEIYKNQGTEEAAGSLVNLYLAHADIVVEKPFERLETLKSASQVFEVQLQQPESALVVLLGGLVPETVHEEDTIEELERLARQTGLFSEVVGRYNDVLSMLEDERDAVDLRRYAGRLLADELDQPDDAIYHFQRALSVDPENIEILEKLEDLYRRVAGWPELAQTLHSRIELSIDPDEKIQLWRKLGEVYEEQLAEIDQAIMCYEQIISLDETDLLALESLERIYETYGRWEHLIDILRQKVNSTYDPEMIIDIRHRIAIVYEEQLNDPARAIGAYADLLANEQGHMPSLEALERLYSMNGQWDDVLEVLNRQLQAVYEPDQQVMIYGKLAALHEEQYEDMDAAVEDYTNVLGVDPSNETAIQNLERLYYTLERWFELVDIVEAHVNLTEDSAMAVQLLNELARVHRDRLQDQHSSIDAFVRSLQYEPIQPEPMRELGSLYELTENWEAAVDVYDRLGGASTDPEEQVELYQRMGDILDAQIMDDARAEQAYRAALQIDPIHPLTIDALRSIYERRFDWQSIIQMLKNANDNARDLTQKALYYAQIGRIYDERLDDLVSALRYYEQAQEFDPNVVEAAEPLIDVYIREKRFERALPLLEKVVKTYETDGNRNPEEYHLRYLQMAQTNEELGLDDQALSYYHRAYEYDQGHLEGMLGLGRQLLRHEDLEASFKIYQNIQLQHLDRLYGEQAREVFFNAGVIKQRLGDRMRALDYFEKALDYDPEHKESINALLENYEATKEWDRYIDLTRQLLAVEQDPKIRFAKLSQIGDIYAEQIQDPGMAVQSYLEALSLEEQSVIILRKLLNLYTNTRQWVEAVDMLNRLIDLEPDDGKKSRFAYTIGVIYRDEVHDWQASVDAFDKALDADCHQLKAFEAIDRILTERKQWKELERAYRRMLKRVAEFKEEEKMGSLYMMLWQNLGEIYRSRLGHMQSAIQAYEMAASLSPNNEKVHLILAQLYERSDGNQAGVIKQHRALIDTNPFRVESYKALFKAYIQEKEYDKAWCMASALAFLQKASDTEMKFYQQYLGKNLQAAKGTFNLEAFRKIYHSEQDMLTTAIMQQLFVVFAGSYARTHREVGINKKKDLLDPNDKLLFCKIYSYVGSRLAPVGLTPMPELYLRKDQAIGMRNINVYPPAFVVGADMFQGRDERELAFTIAKRLCWMLPSHYLGSCGYPTEWLKAFFIIALHITDPSLGLDKQIGPNAPSLIEALQDADRRSPGLMVNIQKLARQFLQSGKNPNLSHWLTCVDHTTTRLGLLLCGDLHKAASCVKNDPIPVGKASVKDKIRELVLFSISEEYFELRRHLGLSIGA